jgi:hypothetical protein
MENRTSIVEIENLRKFDVTPYKTMDFYKLKSEAELLVIDNTNKWQCKGRGMDYLL